MATTAMSGLLGAAPAPATAGGEPTPPRVVLDPGHGGSNAGASGRATGVHEKRLTLEIARVLRRRLEERGFEVLLTRERDIYIPLGERVRRANAFHPDCFISLHANASLAHARRGTETYVLTREAEDIEARRARSHESDPVAGLLAELAHLEAHRASMELAHQIEQRLAERRPGGPAQHLVQQAGFDVLAGAEVPAVLVEVGFLDHPVEGPELLDPAVQARIADALTQAIVDFAGAGAPGSLPAAHDRATQLTPTRRRVWLRADASRRPATR